MKSAALMAQCTKAGSRARPDGVRRRAEPAEIFRLTARHLGDFNLDAKLDFAQDTIKIGLARAVLEEGRR